ncbi:hypothetical protein BCR35DRAFT_94689 [Leucosporidium creatinivorum]|uniref:BTB domain-containing protein n=1 Tax=Leucosporidium creatinivorum TaxID=106004 RepID=A0A1Y2F771_9BASI|nr:hypothetical protein BCR35DRAFT_94689 [Leucosporidium creatinivorum]
MMATAPVAGPSSGALKSAPALKSSPAPSTSLTSLSQLTSGVSRTRGEIPPPLVGASITRVGERVLLFGGRPTSSRSPIACLWGLELETLVWKLQWNASADGNGPAARYFATATAFGSKLVVFGGQGRPREEDAEQSPTTLGDLWIWDTETKSWDSPVIAFAPGVVPPCPRYAHLAVLNTTSSFSFLDSSATLNSTLTLIGGQDSSNRYISSTSTLDLATMTWVAESPYSKSCGSYGTAAVSAHKSVVPTRQRKELHTPDPEGKKEEDFFELSHAIVPDEDDPEPIFVFSNSSHHAFAGTQRELDLLLPFDPTSPPAPPLDLSNRMFGTPSLPPRLRFPSASIIGRHLILSGISLSSDDDEGHYAIWVLDLGREGGVGVAKDLSEPLRWKQIDAREVLAKGSWNRGVGWKNSLLVFGDRRRDAAKDYAQRQLNFTHLAVINLEPNGIYQLPPQVLPSSTQHLGLVTLSQPSLFDYAIVCIDKTIIPCPRRVLESRWPWFRDELAKEDSTAPPPSPSSRKIVASPTHLAFPYAADLALALLQYLATLSLCTKHQLSYESLAGLLAFTEANGTVPDLRPLVIHALHEMLSNDSSLASKIYEAATKGGSSALALHALRLTMMDMERSSSPKDAGRMMRPSLTSDGESSRAGDGTRRAGAT